MKSIICERIEIINHSLFRSDNDWIEEAEKISKENTDLTPTEPGIKIVASSEVNRSNLPTINALGSHLYRDLEVNQNLSTTGNTLNPNTAAFGGNQSFESECSFDTETLDESRTYTDQILSDNMTLNDHSELVQSPVSNNAVLEKKGSLSPTDGKQKEKIEEFLSKYTFLILLVEHFKRENFWLIFMSYPFLISQTIDQLRNPAQALSTRRSGARLHRIRQNHVNSLA